MTRQGSQGITPDASPLAEVHLHLEGSLAIPSAIELARERGHRWGALSVAELRRELRFRTFDGFLAAIREMCFVLCSPAGLERAARELSLLCAADGVAYAEVYCSPLIYVRWGLTFDEVFEALEKGFAGGERQGGARCAILLDSVRQWGPDAAARVLDGYEGCRPGRVAGFGLGGAESVPLDAFRPAFDRARQLGLHTVVHAGETGTAADVRDAVSLLRVERIAHGLAALDDPELLAELARRRITLDLAITSNYRTGVVRGLHPIRRLLDAGVRVSLGTDDRSLFRTNLALEYARAARFGAVRPEELQRIAHDTVECSFASDELKATLLGRQKAEGRRQKAGTTAFADHQG